jgi:C-terminal processing protease CtpA/Prc
LLTQFRGRAALVGTIAPTNPAVSKFSVIERNVAVARVGRFDSRLAGELAGNYRAAGATNKLKGLVLDLRFTEGDDYGTVVSVAELFTAKDQDLLDWGQGMVKSGANAGAMDLPVVVLVNRETLGAPEALAGVLRENGAALVLGSTTAGRALAGREFPLSSGHKLRIASTPVKLGDGSEIPADGLKPDITVVVPLEQEKSLVADPYGSTISVTVSTNSPTSRPARSRRLSEADLVRERREATNQTAPVREAQPGKPAILDPVLARAVDLLKGLAVVRGSQP